MAAHPAVEASVVSRTCFPGIGCDVLVISAEPFPPEGDP